MKVTFAHGCNYLDLHSPAIIVGVQATPARWSAEVALSEACFGLKPHRITGRCSPMARA